MASAEGAGAHKVLVIEDGFAVAGLVRYALARNGGVEVDAVRTASAAFAWIEEQRPDLIVLDVALPD